MPTALPIAVRLIFLPLRSRLRRSGCKVQADPNLNTFGASHPPSQKTPSLRSWQVTLCPHTLDWYTLKAYNSICMPITPPMAVIETEGFLSRSKAILTESERRDPVARLGANPEAGELVPGTGGVRKIRWAISGRGKRGGARVIYYYHNLSIPLFALDIYAKNEKANLTEADKRSLRRLLPILVSQYKKRS